MQRLSMIRLLGAALLVAATGCGLADVADLTEPGRMQVFVRYTLPDGYPVQPGDSLVLETRDFRLYRDTLYAEVFQHPDQFQFSSDSLVRFNLLDQAGEEQWIRVADGAVAPLDYDRLVFQINPTDWVRVGGTRYPLRRTGEAANTVLTLDQTFDLDERGTTALYLTLEVDHVLYRLSDRFIFNARTDDVQVERTP